MGEHPGMFPRKFISFHCLENESNEQKESNTEGTENFPDLPRRSESDGECSDGSESPNKRLVELEVLPVCEIRKESAGGVGVTNLPNAAESIQYVSHDESQIIVSHLLGENLEVLDESGLGQLIENVPETFETGLEEERPCAVDRGVSVGQITESVTFLDDVMNLESGNRTSTPSKDVVYAGGKRKSKGSEAVAECVQRPKIVAFEIGDGSDEESMAFWNEIGREKVGKSCLSSGYTDRTLTEFGLSELQMIATAKAQELGPDSHVVSSDGMVRVPTVGSSGGLEDANAERAKYYPSQSAKSLLKDFFELNPPTHLDGIKTELVKKAKNPFRWSRKGRPNPLPRSGEESGGYVFTEEMMALALFAKVFATGPEEPLNNRHCFFFMLCKKNISMKSRGFTS